MLGEATLDQWSKLDVEARKNLFERKLEVEIDAKQRRLGELQASDPEWRVTNDQLRDLHALQKKVQGISPEDLVAMKTARGQEPEFLRDPAWLFSKDKTTTGIDPRAPGVDMSKIKRTPVKDSPAAKQGHHVAQVGDSWTETTTIHASNSSKVTIDPEHPHEIPRYYRRRHVACDGARIDDATQAPRPAMRPEEFRGLSDAEIDSLRKSVRNNDFTIELHVGPTTLVGSEQRVKSMLSQLRAEVRTSGAFGAAKGQLGKDVLAPTPTRISQDSVDRAADSKDPG